MKKIIYILIAIAFIALGFKVLEVGIKKQEIIECRQWQAQKENIGDIWFSTDWQEAMCNNYNIDLTK